MQIGTSQLLGNPALQVEHTAALSLQQCLGCGDRRERGVDLLNCCRRRL